MSIATKVYKYIFDSDYRITGLINRGFFKNMPDDIALKKMFNAMMGYPLNLDNPKTFNEKLQWLKLYDHNPIYTTMVDKYAVKQYVANIIGEEYIIPTYGVWDHFDEIDFDRLPDQFVLKCTHDSGGLVIVKDKSKLDKKVAKRKLEKSLRQNYYYLGREWPYKNVPPRIIAEKYMEDKETGELRDYKFFCFDGKVKAMFVGTERQKKDVDVKFDFFDENYIHLPFKQGHENAVIPPAKPVNFETMKLLSEKLSDNIPHVRVDFYESNSEVLFGEMTFYHFSGFTPFEPKEWDYQFGDWLKLPSEICGGGYCLIYDDWIAVFREKKEQPRITGPLDYKFYCFNGEPKFLYVGYANIQNGQKHDLLSFYDLSWQKTPFGRNDHDPIPWEVQQPAQFENMIEIARLLSKNVPFLRVDLYWINQRIYFSELTLCPGSGFGKFSPNDWEKEIGTWLHLPPKML